MAKADISVDANIDDQGRLQAVNDLINSCDSVADEIESAFEQFDLTLSDAESKAAKLIPSIQASGKQN